MSRSIEARTAERDAAEASLNDVLVSLLAEMVLRAARLLFLHMRPRTAEAVTG